MMKKIIAVLLILIVHPLSGIANESRDFSAAGFLLIATDGTNKYALLGRDRHRNYFELLSGKPEKVSNLVDGELRNETAYDVALRECNEETRGFFGRMTLIENSDVEQFINYEDFVFFIANIPYVEISTLKNIPIPKQSNKWDVFREIVDYAWVDIKQLTIAEQSQVTAKDGRKINVHNKLAIEIGLASQKGWFSSIH